MRRGNPSIQPGHRSRSCRTEATNSSPEIGSRKLRTGGPYSTTPFCCTSYQFIKRPGSPSRQWNGSPGLIAATRGAHVRNAFRPSAETYSTSIRSSHSGRSRARPPCMASSAANAASLSDSSVTTNTSTSLTPPSNAPTAADPKRYNPPKPGPRTPVTRASNSAATRLTSS